MTPNEGAPDDSDTSALSRLRRDPQDEAAWRQFIEATSPLLVHYLFRLTRNAEVAQDILQDVLLRFVEQKHYNRVKNTNSALAFLRVMARHRFIDWVRTARASRIAASDEGAEAIGAAEAPNSGEAAMILESEIDRLGTLLSTQELQLLEMMLTGHELSAVAGSLNVSYSTAAVRLFRLREKLRHLSDTG